MTLLATRSASATASVAASPQTRRRRPPLSRILIVVALSIGLIATLLPFAWMVLGAFKPNGELIANPTAWLPQQPTLGNFSALLERMDFGRFFFNSTTVAIACVAGNLVFCSMVGYAFAKLEFLGKRVMFALVLTMLIIPGIATFVPLFVTNVAMPGMMSIATFVPLFVTVSNLGLANSHFGLILPYLVTPLGVFLMRQFIAEIPTSLIEAARIDGASELRIFARVVLPLLGPALATLAILTFLAQWNNFLWPLVIAQTEDMYTLPVALALYSVGANGTNYGLLLAGTVIVVVPILALFVALQRYFIQGIANTGIK